MNYLKLRIAWSVWWGVVAALLVALWVRSDTFYDSIHLPATTTRISSWKGHCFVIKSDSGLNQLKWISLHPGISAFEQGIGSALQFRVYGYGTTLAVSNWLTLALIIVLSVGPWLRWRFSLRTLLIAMTLIAVGLGAIVYAMR